MGDKPDFSFWNAWWKEKFHERVEHIRANPQVDYWDKRARDFSAMRRSNDYDYGRKTYAALRHILSADATMLDIGAGPRLLYYSLCREDQIRYGRGTVA